MKKRIDSKNLWVDTDDDGVKRYYSYTTLVAVYDGTDLYLTRQKYSVTTSKHCTYISRLHKWPKPLPLEGSLYKK
jgi:hypothetical protein